MDVVVADRGLDVVGQHERPAATAGPRREPRDGFVGDLGDAAEQVGVQIVPRALDRPAGKRHALADAPVHLAQTDLERARHERAQSVVGVASSCLGPAGQGRALAREVALREEGEVQLVRVERQQDAPVVRAPDGADAGAVTVDDGLVRLPALSTRREDARRLRVGPDLAEDRDRIRAGTRRARADPGARRHEARSALAACRLHAARVERIRGAQRATREVRDRCRPARRACAAPATRVSNRASPFPRRKPSRERFPVPRSCPSVGSTIYLPYFDDRSFHAGDS